MKKKWLADAILFFSLCAVSLAFLLWQNAEKEPGKWAVVYVDGVEIYRQSLEEEGEYLIGGYDGGYNRLVISKGEAYIDEADCPEHLCQKQGKKSFSGDTIICLPHRVYIEIQEESE